VLLQKNHEEGDTVRTYEARIYYNATIYRRTITAKNLEEATRAAFQIAYKLTGYGETGYLEHVAVSPIKRRIGHK
jgi:hypothetical protein